MELGYYFFLFLSLWCLSYLNPQHWGALIKGGSEAMAIEWKEPGLAEVAAVQQLFDKFVQPHLLKLEEATKDLTALSK